MTELERWEPITVRSELAERTDGWVDVIGDVVKLAEHVALTEFVPKALRGKPAAITAAVLFGRELAMPPMQSLANIHVIEGRPSLAAEQMRAMVLAAGHEITYPTLTGRQVLAQGRRRYPDGTWSPPTTVEWNWAMAEAAKLTGKDNWRGYPRAMLEARATAELCRLIFADVTHGLPSTEEIEDADEVPAKVGGAEQRDPANKVSRATRSGTKKAADGASQPAPRAADSTAPSAPPRPPLPGAVATSEPVAGAGEPNAAPPATDPGPEVTPDAPVADLPREEQRQCPVISNGQQCRYRVHGEDVRHTFGGGLGDPVSLKRCGILDEHHPHAWQEQGKTWFACSGTSTVQPSEVGLLASDGDGSFDDVAATGTDEAYADAVDAEIVPDRPEGIHPGQKRALEAAFGSLKVVDRAQRHHAASALLGRRVTTFKPSTEDEGGLSADDASKLLNQLARLQTADDLEQLIQRAAEEWGENGGEAATT